MQKHIANFGLFCCCSESTYESEFNHFLRGQEGLPMDRTASTVEGLTPEQCHGMVQLSKLTPFRKLSQKISGNVQFQAWLNSVSAEQDVPEVWDIEKPLSE